MLVKIIIAKNRKMTRRLYFRIVVALACIFAVLVVTSADTPLNDTANEQHGLWRETRNDSFVDIFDRNKFQGHIRRNDA